MDEQPSTTVQGSQTPPVSTSPSASSQPPTQSKDIVQAVTEVLDKLPPLPENWKQIFIKWYPWILIVTGLLAVPFALATLGVFSIASIYTFGTIFAYAPYGKGVIWLVIAVVNIAVSVVGGLQMLKMRRFGWKLALISEGIDILTSLGHGDGVGFIISLIVIYFLWQVKERYI